MEKVDESKVLDAAREMRWQEPERAVEVLECYIEGHPWLKPSLRSTIRKTPKFEESFANYWRKCRPGLPRLKPPRLRQAWNYRTFRDE